MPTVYKLPGNAIQANTITTTQLVTTVINQIASGSTKSYKYDGNLSLNTGAERLYLSSNTSLSSIDAYVETAPSGAGSKVLANIKKNGGSVVANISIPAGSSSNSNIAPPSAVSFVRGDYITVDIAEIGSATPGANLYIVLTFA